MRALVRSLQFALARGLAMFLGAFTLANLLGAWRVARFDANIWWIDLRFLPSWLSAAMLGAAAMGLLSIGLGLAAPPVIRRCIGGVIAAVMAGALWNAALFYALWLRGDIAPAIPIPLSLLVAGVLALILRSNFRPRGVPARLEQFLFPLVLIAACICFPLLQMLFFGHTDYRRSADAIVVFGARTYADGTPSEALDDRVRTALQLFREGRAPLLIFSGGPGDGPVSEPQAMRSLAISLGVPARAIVLDGEGINTQATVSNTTALFNQYHIKRALVVSHAYHLPRVKLAFARVLSPVASCQDVFTVPARESEPLVAKPYFVAREVAALWVYYLRPLAGG